MKQGQEPQELPENDHRRLGQKLDLFSFHEIAPGAPFWHPKGMIIFRILEEYARKINDKYEYVETSTPIMVKQELFKKSGHWEYYRDNMFWFKNHRDKNEALVLKSMNCPESSYIYNSSIRSYKDLPLRLAEIGRLHRNEKSGTLGGLLRVRQITMDDAHIYAREDQVKDEVLAVLRIIEGFYGLFEFKPRYVLATKPKNSLGTKKDWEVTEHALVNALKRGGIPYTMGKGEGAFYGPKIEVHMEDSQGRDWQLGTAQLDTLMLPNKLKLSYVDEYGKKQMPWVIHRAIFGSFERFIGIILEHYNGALPFWLSPIQITILNVTDVAKKYATDVYNELKKQDYRVFFDDRNETIGKKIREAELQKIPYLLIVGEREIESQKVAVRKRDKGDIGQMTLIEFINKTKEK